MATKPRSRAGMDAEAVARLMAEQDREQEQEQEAPAEAPTVALPKRQPVDPVIEAVAPPQAAPLPTEPLSPPVWDPGKVDGRTLRRTGREPFATRIKPETHESLRRIAYRKQITMAEALEMAVAAFDRT